MISPSMTNRLIPSKPFAVYHPALRDGHAATPLQPTRILGDRP